MSQLRLLAVILTCLLAGPLAAQAPIRAEILPGWQRPDGSRVAAVRLTLSPGWKTYWRAPGDAGIPPTFDWAGSENLKGLTISWPAPEIIDQGGLRTIGYHDAVVLPLTIAPRRADQPVTLRAELDGGVCRDICVPFRLQVQATLDSTATRPTPAIAAALARRPYGAREAGLRAATCALRPSAGGLEIEATLTLPSAGGEEMVVIEPGAPGVWISETDSRREGDRLTAVADIKTSGGLALDRSAVTITVLGQRHAVEISGCSAD